jgi:hypothetical protein
MFGINQGFIVDRLTRENWKTRAVCRTDGEVVYYTYVVRGKLWDGEKKKWVYAMTAYPFPRKGHDYGEYFTKLDDALARANGEDGSDFAVNTHPARQSEYPGSRPAPVYINFMSRLGTKIGIPPSQEEGN